MVFSSLIFICIFLPIVLLTYNISKNISYKNTVLIIASLAFYAWGEPVWIILLLFSSVTDYFHGLIIDKYRGKIGAKLALISSLILNLGLLFVFKYSGFIMENINSAFKLSLPIPQFTLPIGISFYTFQTLSYTIDVYNHKAKVQTSFLRFLTFVSLFPQLVAGPIVRYKDIATELRKRTVTAYDFSRGAEKFVCGLAKKILLANNAGDTAQMLMTSIHMSTLTAWLGVLFYTFQIYFDFSGYSDMAIGLGRMFGFHFKENFEHPYISRSITEFWRRWHISLSSFFRDYVYIPLGGNRRHHILNMFIVWGLTGLWHGASWNFIIWGLFYGIILFIEKKCFNGILQRLPWPLCHIYTMVIVMFGWAIFYFTDTTELLNCIKCMLFINTVPYDLVAISTLYENLWLILICVVACLPWPKILYRHFTEVHSGICTVVEPLVITAGFILCFIMLTGQSYNPFLYFRF